MRHSKRTVLTAEDVNSALSLRNVEATRSVDCKGVGNIQVIDAPLPKAPLDTAVVAHWLAIEGVQPGIPENAPTEAIVAPSENKKSENSKEDGLLVDLKLPVKHVLSRELQLYFDKITELTVTRPESILFKEALVSLAVDSGIHPLVPYFSYFIADEVKFAKSIYLLNISSWLHQLMPSIITCVVAKRLGSKITDNHWELRDFSANLAASVCKRSDALFYSVNNSFKDAIDLLECISQRAAGKCLYDRLKLFPGLLSPPRHPVWRINGRVATNRSSKQSYKRMSSTNLSSQQPPFKKVAADRPAGAMQPIAVAANLQGAPDGFPTRSSGTGVAQPSTSGQVPMKMTGGRQEKGGSVAPKGSAVLAQAWKEDLDARHLLASLFRLFGEGVFSFIKPVEMSFFI
ncbi:hypothetical protein BHE74_00001530 [Ensete ventricosum]|nr:hypothetical protein GW17_00001619 [Ensete ventricosum]RWW89528.1 hypothetical protein BHE74_00001530 [Ensete ventricosum]